MKTTFIQLLSLLLAGMLQVAPLLRTLLPTQGLAPSAWGFILKLGVGATALLGFDAVSQASSISISPSSTSNGIPYIGTITYSGSHAGSVNSMTYNSTCLGSTTTFVDGLSIVYTGGNTAKVTGTPTSAGNFTFSIKSWSGTGCGGSHSDTRSTTLIVIGGGPAAPVIAAAPQNTIAQIGSDVQLSGGASGNPLPQYQWWQGLNPIPGATNNILSLPAVQLTNAGIYTMTASNSQTIGGTIFTLPKTNCYLSVAISPGTNFFALDYTNFAPAGVALTMTTLLTNGTSTTTNSYVWQKNGLTLSGITTPNFSLTAAQVLPINSGTYTINFNSTNSGGAIVQNQNYDSYWCFGYPPVFTNALPASTNLNAGSNVTLNIAIGGSLNAYYSASVGIGYVTNSGIADVFWFQNGNLIATQSYVCDPTSGTTFSNSAVNASLTLSNLNATNAGSYTVVATNFWGSVTSSPVVLSVASSAFAPVVTVPPPAALALLAGQSSAISVTVTGTPPFAFQWQKNGASLANGGVYGGVLTNTLTLTAVTNANSGNYTLAVSNSAGAITSSVAAVTVTLPPAVTAGINGQGNLQLSGTTATGLTYVVQSATNLVGAVWNTVQTSGTGPAGTINFQTNTTSAPSQFYRIMFP